MYRTDKQFMKNPATASSRIYIGNLAEGVVPNNLEEKFGSHGKILGLVVQRGFGFIQFENESQAELAIKNEHGTMLFGRKINVRQAIENTRSKANQQKQQQMQQHYLDFQSNKQKPPPLIKEDNGKPHNDIPPLMQPQVPITQKPPVVQQPSETNTPQHPATPQHQAPPPQHQVPPPQHQAPPPQHQAPPPQHQAPPPQHQAPQQHQPLQQGQHMKDDMPIDKRIKRNKGRQGMNKRDFRDDAPPYYEPPPYQSTYQPPPHIERPERNDCEIIVVSKALTEYAEYIEQHLKSLGLIVDLLFPNEDVPIGRVLANISSRGCLYAILIMPQNEEHRSLTLNVLHGVPEEHRNMPADDAFVFITRNFEAYMRGGSTDTQSDKLTLNSRHPENIQVVINLLAENRQIKTSQYDRLIKYLEERRVLQGQFEISEGIDGGVVPHVTKQAELQSRIMSILNKKEEDLPRITEKSGPENAPLLNDPSVQKALDSLLLGDVLKGLTS
ncbi:PREDICTED: PAX-interacting protein 1 [Nicrophorus vespilloides]|uniref:PAX-interacting protein 1 n=1 Tax=Nicrophorus vespilloides TaxID=110193 RepID=A0ABM1M2Y8_NICVS|nr:PREDICTED: PAX-interacting protein 1 [Nicrophorus vespilloides]